MAFDPQRYYDDYWRSRGDERTAARSRERAQAVLALLGPARNRRLLEIGCGPGWALKMFVDAGFDARGVDVSSDAVERARAAGLRAIVGDAESDVLCSKPGAGETPEIADVVVALEVLEHLVDPAAALQRMRQLLTPGGRLVVSLPNEVALPARLSILWGRLPFGGHADPHVRHFDRRRALELFDAVGLSVVATRPMPLVPPRWRLLQALMMPATSLFPGSFAIATVFLLCAEESGAA